MGKELRFRQDGTFKIVQFTDVHMADGSEKDFRTMEGMTRILDMEKPDLVVFTGDMTYGEENEKLLRMALKPVNEAGIPWAAVFGNHDAELGSGKEALLKVMQESSLCLTEAGEPEVSGVGNYCLMVKGYESDKPSWIMYFLDSGDYNKNKAVEGYDYIKRDQIEWYMRKSREFSSRYGKLPALSFFHIPLQEYKVVWDYKTCYGMKNEEVCCSQQNSGMFSAMLEMGDVKGVFVGHDHINDYWGELFGIKLVYGRATGHNTYGADGFTHGTRVIILKENSEDFDTWIRLEDGNKIVNPVEHRPEKRS